MAQQNILGETIPVPIKGGGQYPEGVIYTGVFITNTSVDVDRLKQLAETTQVLMWRCWNCKTLNTLGAHQCSYCKSDCPPGYDVDLF